MSQLRTCQLRITPMHSSYNTSSPSKVLSMPSPSWSRSGITRRRFPGTIDHVVDVEIHTETVISESTSAPSDVASMYWKSRILANAAGIGREATDKSMAARLRGLDSEKFEEFCGKARTVEVDSYPLWYTTISVEIEKRYPELIVEFLTTYGTFTSVAPDKNGNSSDELSQLSGSIDIYESQRQGAISDEPFLSNTRFCLDGKISEISKNPVDGGGYSDIWTGMLYDERVAIKILRQFSVSVKARVESKLSKRVWREYMIWSTLSHPNILPFLGFSNDFTEMAAFNIPALISPWMSNGTLVSYLEGNPNKRNASMLLGIADGLNYLHARNIIHGDLRGGNVLISGKGVPCLTDFGLSRLLSETRGLTTTSEAAGSLRWMAPELLKGNNGKVTKASDVWAFGMTTIEIISGKRPFFEINLDPVVLRTVVEGNIPSRNDMPDEIWSVCLACWTYQATSRPQISQILNLLRLERIIVSITSQ
ncbi:hypothetical protein M422DRAFT_243228 [Sphaerobolus stellatus SS14]|nr:hypothetical protein M422DRAFT_243228 [Sphaerobolus stellatus SS14]